MATFGRNYKSIKMDSAEGREALFEYATEGILVTNERGKIVKINPAAEKMFGYSKGELVNQMIEVLIPRRFEKKHEGWRMNYHEKPHPRSMGIGMDLFGLKKDGSEFPVEISLSPFRVAETNYVIAFAIDISVRKKNEQAISKNREELEKLTVELKESNAELEKRFRDRTLILEEALHELERSRQELSHSLEKEKELNELKSRFVAMASHEFRTPLATILSSVNLASKYSEQGEMEKQQKHIGRIKAAVAHMTDLLNDVLSISKLEEGKITLSPELFNLHEFVTAVLQELKLIVKEGQQIVYEHEGLEEVYLDQKILRNLIFNLISNAIKFSNEGKEIRVRTEMADNVVRLIVKDQGIGIAEEDKKHLFERFFRGQNATNIQGTGLGLNIVVKYVELMGGKIDFESELEKGTEFRVVLPDKRAQAENSVRG